jgi:hypothetical protein
MPLYFAYGLNMSREDMAARCPGARPLAAARIAGHRFMIMDNGFASLRRDRAGVAYGVLWDLAPAHIRTLDAFEEVGRGLYVKAQQPVIPEGGAAKRALIYFGASGVNGRPQPGYMERVLDAAERAGLPKPYLRELARWLPAPAARAAREPEPARIDPKVRPRFASPLDPGRA